MRHTLEDLLTLMAVLRTESRAVHGTSSKLGHRAPRKNCEVADAIERRAFDELPGELGDLLSSGLLRPIWRRRAALRFSDIVDTLTAKMLRRHPHVFPDGTLRPIARPA